MKKKIIICSLIIGFIILAISIGIYYLIIKAGIPYQDPTPELLQKYNRNMKIGENLILLGISMMSISLILSIVCRIIKKKSKKEKQ